MWKWCMREPESIAQELQVLGDDAPGSIITQCASCRNDTEDARIRTMCAGPQQSTADMRAGGHQGHATVDGVTLKEYLQRLHLTVGAIVMARDHNNVMPARRDPVAYCPCRAGGAAQARSARLLQSLYLALRHGHNSPALAGIAPCGAVLRNENGRWARVIRACPVKNRIDPLTGDGEPARI